MSDPADLPPDAERTRREAARTLIARHHEALLAYTRRLCRDERDAQRLADEVFADTLDAARSGTGPTHAWRPHLLAAARRAAAGWADTGQGARLAPDFAAWLQRLVRTNPEVSSARAAIVSAERDSVAFQAFRQLPEPLQADLWRQLEAPAAEDSPDRPTADTQADPPPHRLVQDLFDTYLQVYAATAPRRECRQLVARLGDAVRRGDTGDPALEAHLARCPECAHARSELVAVRTWQRPVLRDALLLWTGDPGPEPSEAALMPLPPTALRAEPPVPGPSAGPRERPPATERRPRRPSRRAIGLGAAALLVGLVLVTVPQASWGPRQPELRLGAAQPLGVPADPLPLSPSPPSRTPEADPGPASPTATGPSPSASPTRPGAAATAAGATPSPSRLTPDFRLVNQRSGLCVSPGDRTGAGVRLATCTGGDAQRWQFLRGGDGAYQIRNAAGGSCLDGTTEGGNLVTVILRECRTDRPEQRWKVVVDQKAGAFRLFFVPKVPSSDYPDHLLGPTDIWPGPAKDGTSLVHQPNYYLKDDFLFTTN
ncbi:RICIN domain-containing protein [Kitasatospora camelliae]|uniref:RICIN domain-containing protein n=1 Tax=Kitasatospora camelliae TaxID=3156397 RepID=A0AAU8JR89_9ACTN